MDAFDRIYPTLPGNGWLTEPEARLLWGWVNKSEGPILEVGCHQGRSTCLLAATGRTVYVVDPFDGFDDGDPTGRKTMTAFHLNMLQRKCRGRLIIDWSQVPEDIKTGPGWNLWPCRIEQWDILPCGFAYLDGDHTHAGTELQVRVARLTNATHIAVHDVNDSGDGRAIRDVCLAMLGPWEERVERLAVWKVKP